MPRKPTINVRRPPAPDARAVDAFVTKGKKPQTSSRPNVQAPGVVERQSGRLRRRMTIYLSPDIAQKLTVWCATRNTEFSTVIEAALSEHLLLAKKPQND